MVQLNIRNKVIVVVLQELVEILNNVRQANLALVNFCLVLETEYSQLKETVLGNKFLKKILPAFSEVSRRRKGRKNSINKFDTLPIIPDFLQPPNTGD